jgi:hypothetical protein
MYLKQLIEYLEKKDCDLVVPVGFDEPHSYRGDYMCLAFEPARNVTVGAMLQCARDSVGTVYQGWKGGEYRMVGGTEVYLAMYGCSGEKIGTVLLDYMTGIYDSEECEHLRGVISRTTDEVAGLIAERDHIRTDLLSADADLFEYRKKIVEQSKTIHDLSEEKIQVNRAIEVMTGTISDQNEVIKKQNQTILTINAELEAAKQFNPFDLVLMAGSMENISNVINGQTEPFIDEDSVGYAGLKKKLDATTEIIEAFNSQLIDCIRKRNDFERERDFENIIVDSYRDDIEDLKTEVDRLRAIVRNEHAHNTDLLESNKLKYHEIELLEAELSARKQDSEVLKKVVEIVEN